MAFSEFDKAMKELEWYRGNSVPRGVWPIIRIDGRAFSKVTQRLAFQKPYDESFHHVMGFTARVVMENLGGIYGYHQSDEISIVFKPDAGLFDRRSEKIVSVAAGLASAVFNRELNRTADPGDVDFEASFQDEYPHFDARLVCAINEREVVSYFTWRQQDATRNCLNSWAHWTAILKDGKSNTAAGKLFEKQSVGFKNEFLFQRGINFNELPLWQRRGSGLRWTTYMKDGFNPITRQTTQVPRRKVVIDHQLPSGEKYAELVTEILRGT